MISHNKHNLGANEAFVMFLISKLITCFIDGLTSQKEVPINCLLLNESEHILLDFGP